MANITTAFEHRRQGKTHLQYRPAVVEPLAERRSDTWIIFELAKRLGFGDKFWNGDIDAAYAYELATERSHIGAAQKLTGGISLAGANQFMKNTRL